MDIEKEMRVVTLNIRPDVENICNSQEAQI